MDSRLLMKRNLRCSCLLFLLVITLGSVPLTGCGTLKNGQGWGENALYPLDLKRIPHAAYTALLDPKTLIPAAGALVFTGNDFDEKVSSWAAKHNPIFGSKENAANASDYLLNTLYAETILTAFATPSGDDPENWIYWKTKGIAVELIALGATEGATDLLKNATSRTRPDGSDNKSFPSSHSSSSFCSATLANRNLNSIPLSDPVRIPLQVGNILLATSVAWARVEAQKHFPSDALVGAALGNFLGAFIHDAFLGLPQDNGFSFTVFPLKGGARAEFYFAF